VLLNGQDDLAGTQRWYQQAADAGHTSAMFNLGLLLNGQDDLAGAQRWHQQAADAGHTDAMNNLVGRQR
jgi:TPR repeat protein